MTDIYQETINVNLNSLNAVLQPDNANIIYLATYLSNVSFKFPSLLKNEDNILYSSIQVLNAQVPVSYYQINYTNNSLRLTLVGSSATLTTTLTITRGNYNINTLMTEISARFALLGAGTLTCSFNKISGLLTMVLASATYNVSFSVLPSTISKILGFASTTTYISTALSLTSPFPVSLLTIKKLKICSSALSTHSVDSNSGQINLINTIPVNAPVYSIITYENKQSHAPILRSKTINLIDIQIFDENNQFVNFNNVDWTITFALSIFRKKDKHSNNTFKDLTQPILQLVETLKNTIPLGKVENPTVPIPENPSVPLPFTDENDLDFYMYQRGIII